MEPVEILPIGLSFHVALLANMLAAGSLLSQQLNLRWLVAAQVLVLLLNAGLAATLLL